MPKGYNMQNVNTRSRQKVKCREVAKGHRMPAFNQNGSKLSNKLKI